VVVGRPPLAVGTEPDAETNLASPAYFSTLHIPLRQGRFFTSADRAGAPLVAIVNEAMVRQYFANENPIDQQIYFARDPTHTRFTIIGVVGDVKESGPQLDAEPTIYTALLQKHEPWRRWAALVVRSADSASIAPSMKNAVWAVDPQIPVNKVSPFSDLLSASLAPRKFNTLLLLVFSATSLLLSVVGIYGVVSSTVAQRTQEIGVRIALGASVRSVSWLVLRQGLLMTLMGLLLGVAGSVAAGRLLDTLLFGVRTTDLATYTATAILLAVVALLATYIPARRASRVDPTTALRYE